MGIIYVLIIFVFLIIGSFSIGFLGAGVSRRLWERKIRNNFKKFIEGKIENKIYLDDGKIIDVNKFTTFDKDGKEINIDLKELIFKNLAVGEKSKDKSAIKKIPIRKPKEKKKAVKKK